MDATFWVALAFVLFVALIGKKGYQLITQYLDQRAQRIKTELDEAVRLREEAQAMLAGYQRQQRDSVGEAEEIVERAKAEAVRIAEKAEIDLTAALERRTRLAEIKISQAESQALAEVRNLAVDMALAATHRLMAENLDESRAEALIDEAISELGGKLET